MKGVTPTHKQLVAIAGTALVVATALLFAGRRGSDESTASPEACIEAMFKAMQEGDTTAYLSCFTEDLQGKLRSELGSRGEEEFAAYLRQQAEELKGWAIRRDMTEELGQDQVRIVVERIYEGRQWERQGYRLKNASGEWRIYHIEPAELFEPPVPYGTPAFPDAAPPAIERPEGNTGPGAGPSQPDAGRTSAPDNGASGRR